MLAKVMSGNSGWDVVFPSNYFIRPMLEYGLLAPLRHQWLGNLDRLDRPFQSPSWDPQLRWSAPYMWGASGITYNRKLAREAVAQKRLSRAYLNAEVRDQLVAGDVLAAQLWATTAQQAIDASRELAFAYPAEGFALYADNAVVLRESRRQELAHRFIDYLLRPAVATGCGPRSSRREDLLQGDPVCANSAPSTARARSSTSR